jgi:hypothetical protein
MKNLILFFLNGRNSRLNSACVILILLTLVLGCSDAGDSGSSGETAKNIVPPAYIGVWIGEDGSTVTLRNDGSGDYKSGGKSVSGAAVEIDEAAKEIRFTLLGFDTGKYKIDQPPVDDKMRLDGMEYRRSGKFSTAEPDEDFAAAESGKAPSDADLSLLAGKTLRNFDDAVQQGDFSEFYTTVSELMRKKFSIADFNREYADIIRHKDQYKMKTGAPLTFTSKPVLHDDNTFDVYGTYPASNGRNVPFHLRYFNENDKWKTHGVILNP